MRIGVTGAFGFLGANFISALLNNRRRPDRSEGGLEITAFASRTKFSPLFENSDVDMQDLDIIDYETMARKFSGLDAVAHFAGRVDFRSSMRHSVWETDALGSKRVFDAVLAAGVSKLLYVSSICALGAPAGDGAASLALADESSAPYGDPRWPTSFAGPEAALAAVDDSAAGDYRFARSMRVAYFDAKLAGWELAKAYARDKGLPVVTVFPGTAVGAGDLHYAISKLVDNVWEGRLRFSLEGSSSFAAVRDIAEGAILALTKGRVGEGYVIAGRDEDNIGYVEFQERIAGLARREGRLAQLKPRVLPKGLLLALALAAETVLPDGGLSEAFVRAGSVRNVCSSAKARAELGYEPSPGLERAILECRRFGETFARRP
jgi:dihydroflavonol-4-reductase